MAATTYINTSHTTAAGTKTVTGTPAVGDLIIIAVAESGLAGGLNAFAPTDNNPDGLGTYAQAGLAQSAANTDQVALYIRNALIGNASSTVFTAALSASNSGGGLSVWRVSGMTKTGLTALLQAAAVQSGGTPGTTPAPSFGSALSGGPVFGALMSQQATANAISPPAGFTEDAEATYTTPSRVLEVVHLDSGASGTALTWGSTVAAFGALAIELDTSAGGATAHPRSFGTIF
jgi:hypothetical protein